MFRIFRFPCPARTRHRQLHCRTTERRRRDYHRPRVLHVPAEKGVVKWMSGDVYETLATADDTGGAHSVSRSAGRPRAADR
ncbi:hypothetical protein ACRAWF_20980 [Streptomyces sp. L7]